MFIEHSDILWHCRMRLRLTRPTGSSHRLTLRRPAQAQREQAHSFAGQLALVLLPPVIRPALQQQIG
ncbi:hypothetical protein, partial [Escherichia coli]|uniref:hypothetical protein n=1 Tax=Escherichia coli TaxID=562 RepID=UPI001BC8B6E1